MAHYAAIEEVYRNSESRLKSIVTGLESLLATDCSDRIRLLANAFVQQVAALLVTVQGITTRQSTRALQRKVQLADSPEDFHALPSGADSLALTFWLLEQLKSEADRYRSMESAGRLGPAQAAVAELAALFVAQSKRIALEAHRFSDL